MFVRYARNLFAHGMISWDGMQPSYGLTSLAHLFVVLPFVKILPNAFAAIIAGSITGFLLFLAATFFLVRTIVAHRTAVLPLCLAVIASVLALGHESLSIIISSGMDTMTSTAYLSLYLGMLVRIMSASRDYSRSLIVSVGILGGCAYVVRPDLLIYSVMVPLVCILWSDNAQLRSNAKVLLAATGATVLLFLGAAWMYFGTPLPLPFYAKSGLLYDPILAQRYTFIPILQFIISLDSFTLLWFALPLFFIAIRKQLLRRTPYALYVGIGLSVFALTAYFLFFVIQVMPYAGRFYYPALPGLIALLTLLICKGWDAIEPLYRGKIVYGGILGVCIILTAVLLPLFVQASEYTIYALTHQRAQVHLLLKGTTEDSYLNNPSLFAVWPCLAVAENLPSSISLATTEVGVPSVLNSPHPVLDLSGLNDTQIGLGHISVVQAVLEAHSDVVYLPSARDYPALHTSLLVQPEFRKSYTVYPATSTGALGDVAVRRESSAAVPVGACMQKVSLQPPPQGGFYHITLPFLLNE